jgi:hypothetical protein
MAWGMLGIHGRVFAIEETIKRINELGQNGWEVVSLSVRGVENVILLKRPSTRAVPQTTGSTKVQKL